jgi:hypothetical protein
MVINPPTRQAGTAPVYGLGDSGMRSTSFILAFAFLISSCAMAGSAEGNLPGVGTFTYSGSPIATASPLIVGSRY